MSNELKKIIVDSGSTSADWVVVSADGRRHDFSTAGINPLYQDSGSVAAMLASAFDWRACAKAQIFFYGAGCIGGQANDVVSNALQSLMPDAEIHVGTDLLGAARALCGTHSGVACILGTGSNSCLFDGDTIINNVRPLGFILGDEGSGANIGKTVVADALKGLMPKPLAGQMMQWCGMDYAGIISRVYREAYPNRFLAGFARFARENIGNEYVRGIVSRCFQSFVDRNLLQYNGIANLDIHFVGSVAFHFADILTETLQANGLKTGHIERSPIDGLVRYHCAAGNSIA